MREIVGRDAELDELEAWLEIPSSRVLLLEGDAGIGKTTLWRAGVAGARERGHRVLAAEAVQAETQLSFTALRDLLEAAFDDVADELPAPQRETLGVTLLHDAPRGPPPEQGAIGVSLVTALKALAAQGPVLVAIDDVQWLDAASQGPLSYMLRRLDSEPIGILLTRRTADGAADLPLGLDRVDGDRLQVYRLGSLTVGALGRILRQRRGVAYPRPTLHRIAEVSGGNPFFALELARALGERATPLGPGEPLPVPESLHTLVDERLAALPAETFDMLVYASALSRPTLDRLATWDGSPPGESLVQAVDAGLIEIDDGVVRFAHPLLAAAVYEGATESRRAEIHRHLADVVEDPEERGHHLALGAEKPSEEIAGAVEAAAELAAARGAYAAAAALLEEARRLTPAEDNRRRSRRALESGWYLFTAGDSARAKELLEYASESAPPGHLRAEALVRLAWLEHHSGDRRVALRSLQSIELDEPIEDLALCGDVHLLIALSHYIIRDDLTAATKHAREAVAIAERRGNQSQLVSSLTTLALCEFLVGGGWPSAALDRALEIPAEPPDGRILRRPLLHQASMLFYTDQFDEARALFEHVRLLAVERGDESVLPWPLSRLAQLELYAGNWGLAAAHADAGLDLAIQTGQRPLAADLLAVRALVLTHLGQVAEARATAKEALRLAEDTGAGIGRRLARASLGLLCLSVDELDEALEHLQLLRDASEAARIVDPGENRYVGDLGEVLVRLERLPDAARLADESESRAAEVGRPSALALVERVRGLVALKLGETDAGFAAFDRALSYHRRAPIPFEYARTLLARGTAERRVRRRRSARETLGRALAIFEELGAELWAANAQAELARIGGRAPSPGGLTPTEQRVAELVAEGKSNKDVAAELAVSVHTVEAALTSIYRKLDVHSRTEMARKLGETAIAKD
jgi:DNA-binding CsgD family transcriptional regulator